MKAILIVEIQPRRRAKFEERLPSRFVKRRITLTAT